MIDYRKKIEIIDQSIESLKRYKNKCKCMLYLKELEKFNKYYKSFICNKIGNEYHLISKDVNLIMNRKELSSFISAYWLSCYLCKEYYEKKIIKTEDILYYNMYKHMFKINY